MKKVILLSVSLTFLFTASMWAQKFPATLKKHNGSEMSGVVSLPKNTEKTITFAGAGGSTIKIPSTDIALMTLFNDEGGVWAELEYVPVFSQRCSSTGKFDKIETNLWLIVILRGSATLYSTHYSAYISGYQLPEFFHYCRRKGEKGAVMIATSSPSPSSFGHTRIFKKYASKYFADDPITIDMIKNGKFKNKELLQQIVPVIEDYNSRHESANKKQE